MHSYLTQQSLDTPAVASALIEPHWGLSLHSKGGWLLHQHLVQRATLSLIGQS